MSPVDLAPAAPARLQDPEAAVLFLPAEPVWPETAQQLRRLPAPVSGPAPLWWLLYALLPVSLLVLALTEALPPASAGRSVVQVLAVVAVFALALVWVRLNRRRLVAQAAASAALQLQGHPEDPLG